MTDAKVIPLRRVQGATEELSDRALVSAVAEGDQAALGALFDRFHADVFRFISRLSSGAAEDLAQLTFLEAYRSAPRFRGQSSVKTWLFGIAVNLVRNHVRREQRQQALSSALAVLPETDPMTANDAIALEQQRRLLAAALERLSPGLREAYVLCIIEELPGKDAAVALGIREASLWRRLSDARTALRAAIEEMQR